jgi:hypothetical protein
MGDPFTLSSSAVLATRLISNGNSHAWDSTCSLNCKRQNYDLTPTLLNCATVYGGSNDHDSSLCNR